MTASPLEILLLCLGAGRSAAQSERLAQVSPEEWDAVLLAAHERRIAPLLYRGVTHRGVALPDPIARPLKLSYRGNALRNLQLQEQLRKVLLVLQARRIPVIVLKGMYLAEAVYGHLALRTMTDIDLLARKEDLPRIDAVLLAQGYEPFDRVRRVDRDRYHFNYLLPESGVAVEIHWALVASRYPFRIDTEGLWARAHPAPLAPGAALALSPEDLVLHLCLHAAKDLYNTLSLRMLCDLDAVVRRYAAEMDWTAQSVRARSWGVERAVYLFLRLTRDLLNTAIPDEWLAALEPADFDERYLALAREELLAGRRTGHGSLLDLPYRGWLSEAQGPGGKWAAFRDHLLFPHDTMMRKYAVRSTDRHVYLYLPARARDLLLGLGTELGRLARGDPEARARIVRTREVWRLNRWLLSGEDKA